MMSILSCNIIESSFGHQYNIIVNDCDTSYIYNINKKIYDDGFHKARKGDTVIFYIKCKIERVSFDGFKGQYKKIGDRIEFPMPGNDVTITLVKIGRQPNDTLKEDDSTGCIGATEEKIEYSHFGDTLLWVDKSYSGELKVAEGTVVIGNNIFTDHNNIQKVILPKSLREISYKAFAGCGLKEIEIPSKGLEEIEDLAFQDCYNLMNFTIPETVKKIGLNPFMGASSINNIESLSPYFDTDADCLVENETIISYYGTTDIVDLKTIPGHITTIGAFAFYKHTNIQEIRFPLELSSIGTNAFLGCFNIKKVKCAGNPKDIKIESGNENITKNL